MDDEVKALRIKVDQLEKVIMEMQRSIRVKTIDVDNIVLRSTLRIGAGTIALRIDPNGIWAGQEKFSDIATGGLSGTAIGLDGTFTNNP